MLFIRVIDRVSWTWRVIPTFQCSKERGKSVAGIVIRVSGEPIVSESRLQIMSFFSSMTAELISLFSSRFLPRDCLLVLHRTNRLTVHFR